MKRTHRRQLVIGVCVLVGFGFVVARTFRVGGRPATPVRAADTTISWRDAASHYGEYCAVEGTVVATHNSGKACFLNFHPDWRRHFTAVIFRNRFAAFPPRPEEHYRGKKVRVVGRIKKYKGKPEIVLENPAQIQILDHDS